MTAAACGVAAELEAKGFKTRKGTRYSADAVKRMLGEGGSKSRALKHFDAKGRIAGSEQRVIKSGLRGAFGDSRNEQNRHCIAAT
jgi:hypothetical protein